MSSVVISMIHKQHFLECWSAYKQTLPEQIVFDPLMAGPDANGDLTFCWLPADFLGSLQASDFPYRVTAS
jgi:hypothetical protein